MEKYLTIMKVNIIEIKNCVTYKMIINWIYLSGMKLILIIIQQLQNHINRDISFLNYEVYT